MTTLEDRLASLITALGTDYKALKGQGYKGAWSSGLYKAGSVVKYNGVIYAAPADTSNAPAYPTTNYTEQFAVIPSAAYWSFALNGGTVTSENGSTHGVNALTPTKCMVMRASGTGNEVITLTLTFPSGGTFAFVDETNNEYGLSNWTGGDFKIDGVSQYNLGGGPVYNWTQRTFTVSAGTHTFTWTNNGPWGDGRYHWSVGNIVTTGSVITGDWDVVGYQFDVADVTSTKGDLLVRTSSGVARLGVGSYGQSLVADPAATPGLKWGIPAGPALRSGKMSYANGTSLNATLPTGTVAGDLLLIFTFQGYGANAITGATRAATCVVGTIDWKVATSTDITNGYITVTFLGSYSGEVAIASITGANAAPIRTAISLATRQKSGTVLTGGADAVPGDLAFYFTTARVDGSSGMNAIPRGTVIDSRIADTNYSAYLSYRQVASQGLEGYGVQWSNRDAAVDQVDSIAVVKA
jgi:hypothetical protein